MSITTQKGDTGNTSLLFGDRVRKSHPRIEAVGAIDELNAALGLARAHIHVSPGNQLREIQFLLIKKIMGEVASTDTAKYEKAFDPVTTSDVDRLTALAADVEKSIPAPKGWVIPGDTKGSAYLDVARVAARKAERAVIHIQDEGYIINPCLLAYLNRLSDLLWLWARQFEANSWIT